MEMILAAMQLLTRALEAIKAYLEVSYREGEESDHPDAHKHRPKHMRV